MITITIQIKCSMEWGGINELLGIFYRNQTRRRSSFQIVHIIVNTRLKMSYLTIKVAPYRINVVYRYMYMLLQFVSRWTSAHFHLKWYTVHINIYIRVHLETKTKRKTLFNFNYYNVCLNLFLNNFLCTKSRKQHIYKIII